MIYVVTESGGCIGDEWEAVRGVYDTREAAEDRRAELTDEISSSGIYTFYTRGKYPYKTIISIDIYELNAPCGKD